METLSHLSGFKCGFDGLACDLLSRLKGIETDLGPFRAHPLARSLAMHFPV